MDAGGELLFYIFKYGVLLISIVGIIRLWILRNDKQKHILTKIFTSITTIFALLLFIGEYNHNNERMAELAGVYEVQRLNCEDCIKCKATLIDDGTYKLERNNKIIDSGNWDFKDIEFEMQFLRTDLIFDGQVTYGRESDSLKIISSMKSDECFEKIWNKIQSEIERKKH